MHRDNIIPKSLEKYREGEITRRELIAVIKQLKRRKAPGPDEILTEILKEMHEETREEKQVHPNLIP